MVIQGSQSEIDSLSLCEISMVVMLCASVSPLVSHGVDSCQPVSNNRVGEYSITSVFFEYGFCGDWFLIGNVTITVATKK